MATSAEITAVDRNSSIHMAGIAAVGIMMRKIASGSPEATGMTNTVMDWLGGNTRTGITISTSPITTARRMTKELRDPEEPRGRCISIRARTNKQQLGSLSGSDRGGSET